MLLQTSPSVLGCLSLAAGHHSLAEQQLVENQSLECVLDVQSGASPTLGLPPDPEVQSCVIPQLLRYSIMLALVAKIKVLTTRIS